MHVVPGAVEGVDEVSAEAVERPRARSLRPSRVAEIDAQEDDMATRTKIRWAESLEQARGLARERRATIYVDFFSPT